MFWGKTYYLPRVTGVEMLPYLRLKCNLHVKSQNGLIIYHQDHPFVSSARIVGGLPDNRKLITSLF